jgi:hypothetical protein
MVSGNSRWSSNGRGFPESDVLGPGSEVLAALRNIPGSNNHISDWTGFLYPFSQTMAAMT